MMNWTLFSKERPKEEPRRQIIVQWPHGVYSLKWTNELNELITHWAEIEPPTTPDPLSVAWNHYHNSPSYCHHTSALEHFKEGWDAAIRWKEKQ